MKVRLKRSKGEPLRYTYLSKPYCCAGAVRQLLGTRSIPPGVELELHTEEQHNSVKVKDFFKWRNLRLTQVIFPEGTDRTLGGFIPGVEGNAILYKALDNDIVSFKAEHGVNEVYVTIKEIEK